MDHVAELLGELIGEVKGLRADFRGVRGPGLLSLEDVRDATEAVTERLGELEDALLGPDIMDLTDLVDSVDDAAAGISARITVASESAATRQAEALEKLADMFDRLSLSLTGEVGYHLGDIVARLGPETVHNLDSVVEVLSDVRGDLAALR